MRTSDGRRPWIERLVTNRPVRAAYASMVGHLGLLLVLALLATSQRQPARRLAIQFSSAGPVAPDPPEAGVELAAGNADAGPPSAEPAGDDVAEPTTAAEPVPPPVDAALALANTPAVAAEPQADVLAESAGSPTPEPAASQPTPEPARVSPTAGGPQRQPAGREAASRGDPFAGRRGGARAAGAAARGGSQASEAAVGRGLDWLARHQAGDGSWRFDLTGCRCDGACRQPGTVASTTAATGIALLPFLGAGQTHEEGSHRETVTRGLYYLMSRMRVTPRGGDLSEGTMYGHGVATLALAEALGMTGDRMLVPYVRDGVRFIETAQDMHGGGWRYLPGQPGDTTVTAWQLAALKSAALAGVAVPSPTLDGICRFLDRVQVRGGEGYGYLGPQDRPCTSAIGLLCRVYTGWADAAAIDRGLARIAKPGPGREDVYRNFYLSQALLLRDHPAWPRWNRRNRDQLVARQADFGHEAGSWAFTDADTAPGGRLGHTALAILTLEVYYRLLPIYSAEAAERRW